MADAPWRCSECGTVNEPVANACRTCGRWPSLFDLDQSKVDVVGDDLAVPSEPQAEEFEPEVFDDEPPEPTQDESPDPRGRRRWTSLIIPIGVVAYLVITNILNR